MEGPQEPLELQSRKGIFRWHVRRCSVRGSKACDYVLRVWHGSKLVPIAQLGSSGVVHALEASYDNPDDACTAGEEICKQLVIVWQRRQQQLRDQQNQQE